MQYFQNKFRVTSSDESKRGEVDVDGLRYAGLRETFGCGQAISLGRDVDGVEVIYWAGEEGGCRFCQGQTDHETWFKHLVAYRVVVKPGVIRTGLRCPRNTSRRMILAREESTWRTPL